ncbi:unnamed protein product, partial [Rotaria sp. Silwood1]
ERLAAEQQRSIGIRKRNKVLKSSDNNKQLILNDVAETHWFRNK